MFLDLESRLEQESLIKYEGVLLQLGHMLRARIHLGTFGLRKGFVVALLAEREVSE